MYQIMICAILLCEMVLYEMHELLNRDGTALTSIDLVEEIVQTAIFVLSCVQILPQLHELLIITVKQQLPELDSSHHPIMLASLAITVQHKECLLYGALHNGPLIFAVVGLVLGRCSG